jgi:membrane-associated protein
MDLLLQLVDFVLHIDVHLDAIVRSYGAWTYAILFLIIFCETGLVVTPILPGDSLLFAAGTVAARGSLDPVLLVALLSVAGIAGDTANYWIGRYLAPRAKRGIPFVKQKHLDRTHEFYEKHGGKTVVIARFMPIVRTFAPFVAGLGAMTYGKFLLFNIVGGVAWVTICLFAGYFFGRIRVVQDNFTLVILGIIFVSVLPVAYEIWKARRERAA